MPDRAADRRSAHDGAHHDRARPGGYPMEQVASGPSAGPVAHPALLAAAAVRTGTQPVGGRVRVGVQYQSLMDATDEQAHAWRSTNPDSPHCASSVRTAN